MIVKKLTVALAAIAVLAGGCTANNGEDGAGGASTQGALDDGVAATVNGEEISAADVDARFDALAANPQIAPRLEGEDGEATRSTLRAQIVQTAIVTVVVTQAAEELGRPVTDDDIAATLTAVEAEAGGEAELQAALEQQGMTEDQLDEELVGLAAMRNVEEALAEDAGDEGETEPTGDAAPGEMTPSEQRAQQYLSDQVQAADVVVNERYGTWDAETGQVTPPGGMPDMPDAPPAGDGDAGQGGAG